MKKIAIVILMAIFGFASVVSAQENKKPNPQTVIHERMTYMKSNLTLSTKESSTFWKTYEQYLKEEVKIMENYRNNLEKQGIKLGKPGTNKEVIAKLSEKQISYMQDQKFELRKNLLNLESSYHKKYKSILSARKLQEFYDLEYKCKKDLTKKKKEEKKVETGPVNSGKKKR